MSKPSARWTFFFFGPSLDPVFGTVPLRLIPKVSPSPPSPTSDPFLNNFFPACCSRIFGKPSFNPSAGWCDFFPEPMPPYHFFYSGETAWASGICGTVFCERLPTALPRAGPFPKDWAATRPGSAIGPAASDSRDTNLGHHTPWAPNLAYVLRAPNTVSFEKCLRKLLSFPAGNTASEKRFRELERFWGPTGDRTLMSASRRGNIEGPLPPQGWRGGPIRKRGPVPSGASLGNPGLNQGPFAKKRTVPRQMPDGNLGVQNRGLGTYHI